MHGRSSYAVLVSDGAAAPRGLHFQGNLFHPRTKGISNVEIKP